MCYPSDGHGSTKRDSDISGPAQGRLWRVAMSLSKQKTNTIVARLIGMLFLVLSTNGPRALEFSRHSADSSGLNAIAATGRIEAGDSEKLLIPIR
jgi:hypothetical protein